MRGDFERALDRIERASSGNPIRLFPYSRMPKQSAQQPTVVVIDPLIAFGRPIVSAALSDERTPRNQRTPGWKQRESAIDAV